MATQAMRVSVSEWSRKLFELLGQKIEVWFLVGSQDLYGEETLEAVLRNAQKVVKYLNKIFPIKVVLKPVMTTADAITTVILEANLRKNCIGLICWMHTFSPAQMWIMGLSKLLKPFVHLHTQMNVLLPWKDIDMNFMNLNQSAHGGREFGFISVLIRNILALRTVIAGHWESDRVMQKLYTWLDVAIANWDTRRSKVARFGDNMQYVGVTEGNKNLALLQFGYQVLGHGPGHLMPYMRAVQEVAIQNRMQFYYDIYAVQPALLPDGELHENLKQAAMMHEAIFAFLSDGGFTSWTTTFQDLTGWPFLPGLAAQDLMAKGIMYGAEGNWAMAALGRTMEVMNVSYKDSAVTFSEAYTYNLEDGDEKELQAHMLEFSRAVADLSQGKPSLEAHELLIGDNKLWPPRGVFTAFPGPAINVSVVDAGSRFRFVVNKVEVVSPDEPMPNLPVASAICIPEPDMLTAAEVWIELGEAHHSNLAIAGLTPDHMDMYARMNDAEYYLIDEGTTLSDVRKEMRWNRGGWGQ